jgi:hypothetical protein
VYEESVNIRFFDYPTDFKGVLPGPGGEVKRCDALCRKNAIKGATVDLMFQRVDDERMSSAAAYRGSMRRGACRLRRVHHLSMAL